ncbi:unnamed protein product [Ranitomeya imitator]|uniref:Uncharacterized protein n=1 Tax=Ranitomeya imitator TaxID=111125 RepID=A0ABN9MRN9_9NEOB|nr:unnamed protein product [Ranitomeya imitator]
MWARDNAEACVICQSREHETTRCWPPSDKAGTTPSEFQRANYTSKTRNPMTVKNRSLDDPYQELGPSHVFPRLSRYLTSVKHQRSMRRWADKVRLRRSRSVKTRRGHHREYPLSFAACTGNEEITKLLLVKYGAPVTAQDSLGNTVFHTLVLQQNKELACHMYDWILDLVPLKDSRCAEHLENNEGFTPLKLAANEGNIEMFSYLVKRQKNVYWTIGTISYCIYDLTNIDTWMTQKSVLDIIASSQKPQQMPDTGH